MSKRVYTQKEIFDYLKANPLGAKVWIGDLDNMNGNDYIFVDYLNERQIASDNGGCYATRLQISVYVRDFINRKTLVDYVKKLSQFDIQYEMSNEGNYHCAIMTTTVFVNA